MKIAVAAFVSGFVFGLGLLLSGMANPANVIAFLDVTGTWRPALIYTMAAAVLVAAPAYAVIRGRRGLSLWGVRVPPIDRWRIDRPLLLGSVIFGIGWGLSGICPGPGLLLAAGGTFKGLVFVGGMVIGMSLLNMPRQSPRPDVRGIPADHEPER
jgi:uncharacterized membrane protein YedE/YeeE